MTAYKIAGNGPTAKWKASAQVGVGVGLPLTIVLGYAIGRIDPTMPPEVQGALVALIASGITQGAMLLAGYLKRPAEQDRPVVDPTTLPKRPVEPLPPTP